MGELYRLGLEVHHGVQVHIVDEEEHLLKLVDERLSSKQQEQLLAAMQGGVPAMQQGKKTGGMPGETGATDDQFSGAFWGESPVTYKRMVITNKGGPGVLHIVEEQVPEPGAGDVRVRILAAGVAYPDLLMREGVHPLEAPHGPFTPGWDLVGVVDRVGDGVLGLERGQMVAAMPVCGGYAEFICLPQEELIPVPAGLDPAESVSLPLNYVTAYQMMHRSARVAPRQRVLIDGAAGGVGTALLQLGRLVPLEMYGTASKRKHVTVSNLGGTPIEPEVISSSLGEEVGAGREGFDFIEFILDEAMSGFDIGLPGVSGRRDGGMEQARHGLDGSGEGAVAQLLSSLIPESSAGGYDLYSVSQSKRKMVLTTQSASIMLFRQSW